MTYFIIIFIAICLVVVAYGIGFFVGKKDREIIILSQEGKSEKEDEISFWPSEGTRKSLLFLRNLPKNHPEEFESSYGWEMRSLGVPINFMAKLARVFINQKKKGCKFCLVRERKIVIVFGTLSKLFYM